MVEIHKKYVLVSLILNGEVRNFSEVPVISLS